MKEIKKEKKKERKSKENKTFLIHKQ